MAEAKLVLTDALIAEALRRGKQAERASAQQAPRNDNQPRRTKSAARPNATNHFSARPAQARHRAQHEGE